MKRFYIVGFLVLMAFDTLSQVSFKYAGMHALPVQANMAWLLRVFGAPWIYGAVIGYLGSFFTWMHLLKRAPIGPAFAASHLEVVSVLLFSAWLFHEALTAPRLIGAMAIVLGIVLLGIAEGREEEGESQESDHEGASPTPPA